MEEIGCRAQGLTLDLTQSQKSPREEGRFNLILRKKLSRD